MQSPFQHRRALSQNIYWIGSEPTMSWRIEVWLVSRFSEQHVMTVGPKDSITQYLSNHCPRSVILRTAVSEAAVVAHPIKDTATENVRTYIRPIAAKYRPAA